MNARGLWNQVEQNVSPPITSIKASQSCTALKVAVSHTLLLFKVNISCHGQDIVIKGAETPVKPPVGSSYSLDQKFIIYLSYSVNKSEGEPNVSDIMIFLGTLYPHLCIFSLQRERKRFLLSRQKLIAGSFGSVPSLQMRVWPGLLYYDDSIQLLSRSISTNKQTKNT